ncbi:sulfatase-like hydrolase/transferase [Streptomyces sp. enrichment culture]|uniref:sulfatase-like hydrolase/transferase n=1 Tax=Streptomyces sp. enrichment culture TaxID=1795815 RepID=UPI003F5586B9
MPDRRRFLIATATALAATAVTGPSAAAAAGPPSAAATTRPNIVLVLADDLGSGELGAYGQRLISTPALDRLAAEGMLFTDAYAGAPVCAPSRCSLLTGLHSGHATVRQNPFSGPQAALTADDTTFAEPLRAVGYRTALFGKWGFGPEAAHQPSHPNQRGFDEFYGYIDHNHAHDYYPDHLWHNGVKEALPANTDGAKGTYAPDAFLARSVDFVKNTSGPFLLCYAPTLPHSPSDVPGTGAYATRPWPEADKGHAAQVTLLDTHVAELVRALRDSGKAADTVVIVTSDNGPHEEGGVDPDRFDANGPLRGYKRNLYEGGVRVPLLVWSPGRVPAGTVARPTPFTDLLPTLADLAGAPRPRDVDGLSLAGLLTTGTGAPRHAHLYWYRNDPWSTPRAAREDGGRILTLAEAVREERWKAVRFAPGRDRTAPDDRWHVELYDLAADRGERTDVAAAHPDVAARLVAAMRAAWADDYRRVPFGLRLEVPAGVGAGGAYEIAVTVSNGSAGPWAGVAPVVTGPAGWGLRRTSGPARADLPVGGTLRQTWRLTVPAGAAVTGRSLAAAATGTWAGRALRFDAGHRFPAPG